MAECERGGGRRRLGERVCADRLTSALWKLVHGITILIRRLKP
jgi:hypothetical protein